MKTLAERIETAFGNYVTATQVGNRVVVEATDKNDFCGSWTFNETDDFLIVSETLDAALQP